MPIYSFHYRMEEKESRVARDIEQSTKDGRLWKPKDLVESLLLAIKSREQRNRLILRQVSLSIRLSNTGWRRALAKEAAQLDFMDDPVETATLGQSRPELEKKAESGTRQGVAAAEDLGQSRPSAVPDRAESPMEVVLDLEVTDAEEERLLGDSPPRLVDASPDRLPAVQQTRTLAERRTSPRKTTSHPAPLEYGKQEKATLGVSPERESARGLANRSPVRGCGPSPRQLPQSDQASSPPVSSRRDRRSSPSKSTRLDRRSSPGSRRDGTDDGVQKGPGIQATVVAGRRGVV